MSNDKSVSKKDKIKMYLIKVIIPHLNALIKFQYGKTLYQPERSNSNYWKEDISHRRFYRVNVQIYYQDIDINKV